MEPNNPFLISGYYSPKYFCDRQEETQTLLNALQNGRNLTLVSPRRMGKTGLIKHTFYNLQNTNSDIFVFYIDIFSTQSLADFVRLFAATVLGKLDTMPQKAMARITKFIKSCRPTFTFDEITGMPKVSIELSPAQEEATLSEIFDYLQSSEKRCYIAIDEFQQITEYPEKGVEALLRSHIQFLSNVNFIFAGSKQHLMQEMFLSAKRPFYQSTQLLTIDSINIQPYYEFAHLFFLKIGKELPEDVFSKIYQRFDGHTWYIQSVLNRLYGYNQKVTDKTVEAAITEIIDEYSYTYESLYNLYPTGCQRLLKAIAHEEPIKEILAGDFITRHQLKAASSVSSSLKKLMDNELAYKSLKGYIVYDRFFSEWLRRQCF